MFSLTPRFQRGTFLFAIVASCIPVPSFAAEQFLQPAHGEFSRGAAGDDLKAGLQADQQSKTASEPAANNGLDDLLDLDIEQLGKVTVHSRSSATKLNSPSSQLDSDAIDFGESSTTGELLREATSVSVRRTSALNLDPRIRGYHSEQITATANGMNQLKTRVDIDSLFSQIDPGIVRDITVVDGPYTSLYGPGFGFLIAETFAAPRYPQTTEMHGSTYFTYGSNGRTIYTRQNLWGGGRDWGIYSSYGLRTGNDYDTGDNSEFLVPSSFNKWDGFLAFSYDLTSCSRMEFDYLRTEINDTELPGVVYDINNSKNDQFNVRYVFQDDPQGPERCVLQCWLHQTGYHGDASRESKQRTFYRDFVTLPSFDDFPTNTIGGGRSDSMGTRALLTFGEADSAQLTVGGDWRRYKQVYRETDLNSDGEIVYDGNIFGIPKSCRDNYGIFAHLLLPGNEDVTFTFGGRIDRATNSVDINDSVVTEFAGDPDDYYFDAGLEEPSATLGMSYGTVKLRLSQHFSLNVGAAYAMRSPSLAELYSDEAFVPIVRFGNGYMNGQSDLSPERTLQFDLGLTYEGEKTFFGVRGFYSHINNYIWTSPAYIDPSAPDFIDGGHNLGRDFTYFDWRTDIGTANENADTNNAGYIYTNIDLATIAGVDFFVDRQVRDWLSVGGDLAYVHGTNRSPVQAVWNDDDELVFLPTVDSEPLPNIYPFNGKAWIRVYEPQAQRWSLGFVARMVRRQDRVAFTLSELATPGFAVFDLRGQYKHTDNLQLTLGIENLFNRTYYEHGSLAILNRAGDAVFVKEPGINVRVGATWTF